MKKSVSSSLLAGFLSFSVIVSSPAFGAPTSIANGDFQDGANLATTIRGWTALNQRVDLGLTSIAGCTSVDTSNYSNLREFFVEAGKEFFGNFEIASDSTYDYDIFLNGIVNVTSASVNEDGTEMTYTASNDFQVGDFVRVLWESDPQYAVTGAQVTFANATTFKVSGSFADILNTTESSGGTARSYVTALGLPFGFSDNQVTEVETAFLQTAPGVRVFEQDWTSAQRAAVAAITRDPEVAKDSLDIPFDDGPPTFRTGLRTNGSADDSYESWQTFLPDLQRNSQFVELYSNMNAEGESMNRLGYVIHGPAIYSDEFSARTVDDLSLAYATSNGRDDFKVFGYLLNTADCSQTEVLDETGEIKSWETVRVAIPSNGTYRFVFVLGAYDQNWGSGSGAVMFLDDVTLSPNPERVAAAAPQPTLAKTGSDNYWLFVAGLSAAITGVALLAVSRRKRIW